MSPIRNPHHPVEVQLSTTAISAAAETGEVGRRHGILPDRDHQPPAGLLLGWRRFLDHGPGRPAPKPSAASRPAPRTPPRSAA